MKCLYCNSELPNEANFCPKCLHQIVCLSCKRPLVKDSNICVYCGKPIAQNNSSNSVANIIEFTENESGTRTYKASFSDSTASNFVESFTNLLLSNKQTNRKELASTNITEGQAFKDIDSVKDLSDNNPKFDELAILKTIFKDKDGEISLYDTHIKARNQRDFVSRISILYIYYHNLKNGKEVNITDLNNFIVQERLEENLFKTWLSKSKRTINVTKTNVGLRFDGEEKAKQILSEILDTSKLDRYKFKINNRYSKLKEGNNINSTKTKRIYKNRHSTECQIDSSLNLKPKDKKSLTDFYNEFLIKKTIERNLVFVYYLERILGIQQITVNHIFTCYKEIKANIPSSLYQRLTNTKSLTGWIDTSNMNDIKITATGINHLEQNMIRK